MTRLSFTIPIEPGLLAVNRKHTVYHGTVEGQFARIGKTDRFQAAFDEAVLHVRSAVVRARWRTRSTEVEITIEAHWPSAKGDWDAVSKAVSDCLADGLVYEDDKLVRQGTLRRFWRSSEPRIVVTVEDARDDEQSE